MPYVIAMVSVSSRDYYSWITLASSPGFPLPLLGTKNELVFRTQEREAWGEAMITYFWIYVWCLRDSGPINLPTSQE